MRRPSRCVTVPKKPWRHLRSEQAQRDGEVCNKSLKRSRRLVMVMILGIISRTIGSDHLIKDVRMILCVLPGPSPETGPRCFSYADARVNGAMDAVWMVTCGYMMCQLLGCWYVMIGWWSQKYWVDLKWCRGRRQRKPQKPKSWRKKRKRSKRRRHRKQVAHKKQKENRRGCTPSVVTSNIHDESFFHNAHVILKEFSD